MNKITVDGLEVELTLGADPEIFVKKDDKYYSAHRLVPGTKENPHPVEKGAIQVDGMALEFNINPAESMEEFVDNINSVMQSLVDAMPEGLQLAIVPTAEFGAEYIQAQPEEAKELGCSADFNAYTGKENPKPNEDAPYRTAAGHVHIGWTAGASLEDPEHLEVCRELTKILDLYLGVPSVLKDSDSKRRELYGQAGAFRPKEYGLEYRVLSNFWLKSKKDMEWVYQQVTRAVTDYLKNFRVTDPKVPQIINTSDIEGAKEYA